MIKDCTFIDAEKKQFKYDQQFLNVIFLSTVVIMSLAIFLEICNPP